MHFHFLIHSRLMTVSATKINIFNYSSWMKIMSRPVNGKEKTKQNVSSRFNQVTNRSSVSTMMRNAKRAICWLDLTLLLISMSDDDGRCLRHLWKVILIDSNRAISPLFQHCVYKFVSKNSLIIQPKNKKQQEKWKESSRARKSWLMLQFKIISLRTTMLKWFMESFERESLDRIQKHTHFTISEYEQT